LIRECLCGTCVFWRGHSLQCAERLFQATGLEIQLCEAGVDLRAAGALEQVDRAGGLSIPVEQCRE
jgi:hypothetical protein